MLIQVNIPERLNEELEVYKIRNKLIRKSDAINKILEDYLLKNGKK